MNLPHLVSKLPIMVCLAIAGGSYFALRAEQRVSRRNRYGPSAGAFPRETASRVIRRIEAKGCPRLGDTERADIAALIRGLREGRVDKELRARIIARRRAAVVQSYEEVLPAAA